MRLLAEIPQGKLIKIAVCCWAVLWTTANAAGSENEPLMNAIREQLLNDGSAHGPEGAGLAPRSASDLHQLKSIPQTPTSPKVMTPSQLLSSKELTLMSEEELSESVRHKVRHLHQSVAKCVGTINSPSYEVIERLVRLVEFIKAHKKEWLEGEWFAKSRSLYIHPEGGRLDMPVHFYPSGRIYFYLKNFDAQKESGNFKKFVRGVEYETEIASAHLYMPILRQHHKSYVRLAMHELGMMSRFDDDDQKAGLLGFNDASMYWEQEPQEQQLCPVVCFETRLCRCGDLMRFCQQKTSLPLCEVVYLALQAAKLVDRLHQAKRILHRDLKLDNFGVDGDDGELPSLLLFDFGLAEPLSEDAGQKLCGSPGKIAPEVCLSIVGKGRAFNGGEAGKRVDIYALGIVFLQILGRHGCLELLKMIKQLDSLAIKGADITAIATIYQQLAEETASLSKNLRKFADARVARNFIALIVEMLQLDPMQRPSSEEVVARLEMLDQD